MLPEGKTKQVDVLFVIAHAPIATMAFPDGGSEPYVGLAIAMELAMNELSEKFPVFFGGKTQPSTGYERRHTPQQKSRKS